MSGGIIGLVGLQGVGKSSALRVLQIFNMIKQGESYKEQHKESLPSHLVDTVLFKWRREPQLFTSLLNGTHELSADFSRVYKSKLVEVTKPSLQFLNRSVIDNPQTLNPEWAERQIGRKNMQVLRQTVWLELLRSKKTILIDTPDYSKTDRRLMAKDLMELYWMWDLLSRCETPDGKRKPNIVVAIQKEMFGGHFFFDKMQKIELQPLQPETMIEAYKRRFKNTDPFTSDALLTLARMSRGIFRRFLRYIMLTLNLWEEKQGVGRGLIGTETVREAVTMERLAEDMDLELTELFPKHSDLKSLAVRLLVLLEESGERKQSELADFLEVKPYELSRLLTKLEAAHYISRRRDGNDKIVSLFPIQDKADKTIAVM
jgi:DNA-binding MarR family transcriptional regulator